MKKRIVLLPGDGIGPEVVTQGVKVMEAINEVFDHEFEWSKELIGASSIRENAVPITQEALDNCMNSDAILLGAIGDPEFDNNPELKVRPEQGLLQLRKALQLHTNIRPVATYEILKEVSPLKEQILKNVDLTIFRELTGGIYFGEKTLSEDGQIASDSCSYSVEEIERIAHKAFQAAQNRKRKLTLVDKANVLETSRLWRKVIQQLSAQYSDVEVDYLFVDNAAMQLMLNPSGFDVLLTENMFGDILSDLASVITGSLGMLPSASIGNEAAMFEPVHGSYPQAAGKDIANPTATILSVAMMYDHFGLFQEAELIRKGVDWAIKEGIVTQDLSQENPSRCSKVGDIIAYFIEEKGQMTLGKNNILESSDCII